MVIIKIESHHHLSILFIGIKEKMVKCDFFKLFPTKLSRINPYTNLIVNAKAMDVAQPIWLSGCPKKGHFRAKKAFLAYLITILKVLI